MSLFNRLLEKDESEVLPGNLETQEDKPADFFFCLNIKYMESEIGNTSRSRSSRSRRE